MTTVTLDLESFGSLVGGLITVLVGMYTYLNQKGYIQKWRTKLSIEDEVAQVATQQNGSALLKLSIPDELITVFKDISADSENVIDAQKIAEILNNFIEIEQILGSEKPLTKEEKTQIRCILNRTLKTYKKSEIIGK